jgi:hypothetical protein
MVTNVLEEHNANPEDGGNSSETLEPCSKLHGVTSQKTAVLIVFRTYFLVFIFKLDADMLLIIYKKFWEELIAYCFWYDTDRIGNVAVV